MAYIKKPPSLVNREIKLEQPVSELLDDYSRFVECTPDPRSELCPQEAVVARSGVSQMAG